MDKILSPIKERVIQFLDKERITKESFFELTGISASNFKGKGKESELGGDKLVKILTMFSNLNPEWLLLGNGDMLKSSNIHITNNKHDQIVTIPIVDINVAAGMGFYNSDFLDVEDEIKLPSYLIKHKSQHFGVKVKGASMSPTLQDSSYLIIRLLEKQEWKHMPNNHVYVLGDREGKGYVKRIRNRFDRGFIVCTSDNLDKNTYPNFNLSADEVNTIWHVEWYLSAKLDNINENYYSEMIDLKNRVEDIEAILGKQTIDNFNKSGLSL